jgi:Arylsulfotransferase (ASST)
MLSFKVITRFYPLIVEIDIESGKVLFEWSSIENVPFSETVLPLGLRGPDQGTSSSSAWDYFHINSVDKHGDGHYIISARHTNTIYKINSTDGSIIWRLGGKHSNFKHADGTSFAFQHHARYRGKDKAGRTLLSLFDNHSARQGQDHAFVDDVPSSGKILLVDEIHLTVSLQVQYVSPKPIVAQSQGNLHILDNGNAVIGWGQVPAITEFLQNGTVVYHAEFHFDGEGSETESYRNFKFPWQGVSSEEIAVVHEDGKIYVSWNGDTVVDKWAIWANEKGHWNEVGRVNRSAFETAIEVGRHEQVVVKGIDKTGVVVGESRVLALDSAVVLGFVTQRR